MLSSRCLRTNLVVQFLREPSIYNNPIPIWGQSGQPSLKCDINEKCWILTIGNNKFGYSWFTSHRVHMTTPGDTLGSTMYGFNTICIVVQFVVGQKRRHFYGTENKTEHYHILKRQSLKKHKLLNVLYAQEKI